jgi:SAM-dependent methyltransferase
MDLIPGPPPPSFRDSMAVTYDNVAAQRDEMGEADWRWPFAEQFLTRLQAEHKSRLLEIGAGVGYTSLWFAHRGIDVVATDLSPAQVDIARAKGLDAHVADMFDLDFAAESFDAIWAMNCIHHVPSADLPDVVAGIAEVLRPTGLFYLAVWGGRDIEGMYENDFYQPPRFFAIRSDERLRAALETTFTVESFETFLPDEQEDDDGLHMQSFLLRKR